MSRQQLVALIVAVWVIGYVIACEIVRQELADHHPTAETDPADAQVWAVLSEARRITQEAAGGMA